MSKSNKWPVIGTVLGETNINEFSFTLKSHKASKGDIVCTQTKIPSDIDENKIIDALKIFTERLDIIIEPSSAVALAGLFANKEYYRNKKVGVVISGGNVDLESLKALIN